MNRAATLLVAASIGATLLAPRSLAQSSTTTTTTTSTRSTTPTNPNLRFFNQYIQDAAIVQRHWFEPDFQYDNGACPPLENADGTLFTPIVAIAPTKNLEFGGQISYIDYNLNDTLFGGDFGPGGFDGASGFGDITAWGKYRFVDSPQTFVTGGALVQFPTGSDEDGLGTG